MARQRKCAKTSRHRVVPHFGETLPETAFAVADDLASRLANRGLENDALLVALHYKHDNHCRIHKTVRVTRSMAAGVAGLLWSIAGMAATLEAWEGRKNSE